MNYPAISPAMPTSAKLYSEPLNPEGIYQARKNKPEMPPIKRLGANTPPIPPAPVVSEVAMALKNKTQIKNQ
jgi:hypothetical protein